VSGGRVNYFGVYATEGMPRYPGTKFPTPGLPRLSAGGILVRRRFSPRKRRLASFGGHRLPIFWLHRHARPPRLRLEFQEETNHARQQI